LQRRTKSIIFSSNYASNIKKQKRSKNSGLLVIKN